MANIKILAQSKSLAFLPICNLRPGSYTRVAMDLLSLTSRQLRRAADIVDKIEKLKGELSDVLVSSTSTTRMPKRKRKLSDAGRLAIAAAQKARWAKQKVKSKLKPLAKKTRTMSAVARAKIAAAAKARWAKAKAAGKNAL